MAERDVLTWHKLYFTFDALSANSNTMQPMLLTGFSRATWAGKNMNEDIRRSGLSLRWCLAGTMSSVNASEI